MSDRNQLVISILIGLGCLVLGLFFWLDRGEQARLSGGVGEGMVDRPVEDPVIHARRESGAPAVDESDAAKVPESLIIAGTITAVDENGEPVVVEEGRLEYEIFGPDGPAPRRPARVAKGRFAFELRPDDQLFMAGKLRFGRGYVAENWELSWIERGDLLAEGLELRTEIGAQGRVSVVEAGHWEGPFEELEGIELHVDWPWFVTDAEGRRRRATPLAVEDAPLDLRPGCGSSNHFVLTRPGHAPRRAGRGAIERIELEPAGRLEVAMQVDWAQIHRRNRLRLRITPSRGFGGWANRSWPDFPLAGSRHRRLVFDRVPRGTVTVALVGGAAGVLAERSVEIRPGELSRIDFGADLGDLRHAPTHLHGRIRGWSGRPFETHEHFTIRLLRDGEEIRSVGIIRRSMRMPDSGPRDTIDFEFEKVLPGPLEIDFLGHLLPVDLPPEGRDDVRIDFDNLDVLELVIRDEAGRPLGPDEIALSQNPFGELRHSPTRGAFLPISRRDDVRYWLLDVEGERRGPISRIRDHEFAGKKRYERVVGPALAVEFELGASDPQLLGFFRNVARSGTNQRLIQVETLAGEPTRIESIELDEDILRVWLADPGRYRFAINPRYGFQGETTVELLRSADGRPPRAPLTIEAAGEELRGWFRMAEEEN